MKNIDVPTLTDQKNGPPSRGDRTIGKEWYKGYYASQGANRNSLLFNPEVLFQNLAQEAAVVRAVQSIGSNGLDERVLDVGCGDGSSLITFLRLGFPPHNLYGVDLQEGRIRRAQERFPSMHFQQGDATRLDYASETFDLLFESTMFIHSVDVQLSQQIADEMLRVTKPGRHLILCDWRYAKPGSDAHKALSPKRIARLFLAGEKAVRCGVFRGPLIPPIGRFLSHRSPATYFLLQGLFPFLVGQLVTVLRKI